MQKFVGTGVALATPMDEHGNVDFDGLERLVNFQIDNEIDYLVVLGTTGEPATLTTEEKQLVQEKIIEVTARRVPLVFGLGGNNTRALVNELENSDLSAYDAILSVSPYYNKPTQEGIYQHYKAISEASPLPIILYNVPGRTAQNVTPDTIVRLANDFENIIAVKEAAGDLEQAKLLLRDAPKGFLVISGDDMIALPMTLAGGSGVISVIGQGFPLDFSRMIRLGLQGESASAYKIQHRFEAIIDYIFEEGNPAGIKALLRTLEVSGDQVRLPLVKATPELQQKIEQFVLNYESNLAP